MNYPRWKIHLGEYIFSWRWSCALQWTMSDEWSLTFALISETIFNSRDRGDIRGILESNQILEVIWAPAEMVMRAGAAHHPVWTTTKSHILNRTVNITNKSQSKCAKVSVAHSISCYFRSIFPKFFKKKCHFFSKFHEKSVTDELQTSGSAA